MKKFILHNIEILKKPIEQNLIWFLFTYMAGAFCNALFPWEGSRLIGFFQLFLDVYVVVVIGSLLPRKVWNIAKWILTIFFYTVSIIDLFCWFRLATPISPTLLVTFMQTNSNEAQEALDAYIDYGYILKLLPLFILLAMHIVASNSHRIKAYLNRLTVKFSTAITCAVPLMLAVTLSMCLKNEIFIFYRVALGYNVKDTLITTDIVPTVRLYTPVHRFLGAIRDAEQNKDIIKHLHANLELTAVDSCDFRSRNIILIIGESYNRHHSQLYGYNKPTTPLQSQHMKNGNLVVFEDAVAMYNLTNEIFPAMLSTHCIGDSTDWFRTPMFTTLFRNAGYEVSFFSNQYIKDISDSYSDFHEDLLLNNEKMSAAQFSRRNSVRYTYDKELIEEFDSLTSESKGNLVIFHLMGQHINFKSRYPKEFGYFNGEMYSNISPEYRELIAHYDNATLYNDYILNLIIEKFQNEDAIIIHVADHGERTCDNGDDYGRTFSYKPSDVKQQYEIPLWIYFTDRYKELHPDIVQSVIEAKGDPLCTENIAHMLLYLGGIHTVHYSDAHNPLSAGFNPDAPRIINNKYNYDEIINNTKKQ